jgi:hypothetical protein
LNSRRWLRLGAKALHDIAAIGFGGGLAACLVINLTANRAAFPEFAAARQVFAAIAQQVLIPSMAVVVVSGLIAMMATRGYQDAGWAWVKAALGLSVFVATFLVVGASSKQAELAEVAADPVLLDAMLRSERNTLLLLMVLCVVNVVLAVWRPRLTIKIR